MQEPIEHIRELLDSIYRNESRRIHATLIRLLGDFDRAEDALHDSFAAAMEQWPHEGIPANPRAWLVSAGRFKAIDRIRRLARFEFSFDQDANLLEAGTDDPAVQIDQGIVDDELRLIFTCCHPALPLEARIALTLREVNGLTTEEIARAFLTSPATLAQRIVRAKAKIRDARIPYEIPLSSEIAERLDAVLHVIYLIFNEGYSATSGHMLTRPDLSGEAIRLGRLLLQLVSARTSDMDGQESEMMGLLALMLLQESRRTARTSPAGDLILLEDQDRSLWDREQMKEGISLVERACAFHRVGTYTLQAAIAAVHAEAAVAGGTDWAKIVGLYDLLLQLEPSPVIELNRAVAVAMRDGIQTGLRIIDAILDRGDLADYHLAHASRAELYRRLGKTTEARTSYLRALALTRQEPERRFLERRKNELG